MEIEYCLFRLGIRVLLFLVTIIFYIVVIYRKKSFFIMLFFKKSVFREIYKGKNDLIFFRTVNIGLIFIMLMILGFLIKVVMDMPYIMNHDYSHMEGYTIGDSKGGANVSIERRSVFVKDDQTGREIEITVFSNYIKDNTYVEVEYLPHTHYGAVIQKNK